MVTLTRKAIPFPSLDSLFILVSADPSLVMVVLSETSWRAAEFFPGGAKDLAADDALVFHGAHPFLIHVVRTGWSDDRQQPTDRHDDSPKDVERSVHAPIIPYAGEGGKHGIILDNPIADVHGDSYQGKYAP